MSDSESDIKKNVIVRRKPKIPKEITKEWLLIQFNKLLLDNNGGSLNYIGKVKLKHDYSHYMNLIYNTNNLDDFEPELEFCESDIQKDVWLFFRLKISSFEYSYMCGRIIKILVRDIKTKKYVGVISLGSESPCKLIDHYINWTNDMKYKHKKYNNIMNITTCVGIPPFSFNVNIGKLLVMLMFSKEIYDYVYNLYGDILACITTYSLYGKSVQYDRLKEIKYLGLTKGECVSHIPKWLNDCTTTYIKSLGINKYFKRRLYKFDFLIKKLGFPKEIKKGMQKGCYIGFTGLNSIDFLTCKTDKFIPKKLISVNEIYNFWKDRWAVNRFKHLISTKRLMLDCDYDTSIIDEKDYNRIKQIHKKRNDNIKPSEKKLTYLEKIEIIEYFINSKKKSILSMSVYFTDKFKKNVNRKTIANLIY